MHNNAVNFERQNRMHRIRRVSSGMKWCATLFILLLAAIFVLIGGMFLAPEFAGLVTSDAAAFSHTWQQIGAAALDTSLVNRPIADIPFWQRVGLSLAVLVGIAMLVAALWQIRQLFANFSKSDFFSQNSLSRIVSLGGWLAALAVYDIVGGMIASVLLTLDFPAGQRMLTIELEGVEAFFLIFGIIMILFGWIMREAASIAEENKQFV